jgi:hypothetical protein
LNLLLRFCELMGTGLNVVAAEILHLLFVFSITINLHIGSNFLLIFNILMYFLYFTGVG